MKKSVFVILTCTLVMVFAGCGAEDADGAVSSDGSELEQIVATNITEEQDASEILEPSEKLESSSEVSELDANTDDMSTDKVLNIVCRRTYFWAMGSDYIYIDSDGKIYREGEMEEPLWSPLGACDEIYTGEQFTEEELNEFLSIDIDDEGRQKEMLSKKGIRFRR